MVIISDVDELAGTQDPPGATCLEVGDRNCASAAQASQRAAEACCQKALQAGGLAEEVDRRSVVNEKKHRGTEPSGLGCVSA